MPNVYIEARPKGRPHGSPIEDYVVEDRADHVLSTHKTQQEAIDWAKKQGHSPLVAGCGTRTIKISRTSGGQRRKAPRPRRRPVRAGTASARRVARAA